MKLPRLNLIRILRRLFCRHKHLSETATEIYCAACGAAWKKRNDRKE